MIRLPSLQKPYDAIFSGDGALKQPPAKPVKDADDTTIAKYKAEYADYLATLTSCQETGDWTPLLLEGQVPLKFVLQQVDRNIWRSLVDRAALPASNSRHVGLGSILALLFRLAIVEIVGAEGIRVRREPDPAWDGWTMAQPEIVTILDAANQNIVSEIGGSIYRRLVDVSPKS